MSFVRVLVTLGRTEATRAAGLFGNVGGARGYMPDVSVSRSMSMASPDDEKRRRHYEERASFEIEVSSAAPAVTSSIVVEPITRCSRLI